MNALNLIYFITVIYVWLCEVYKRSHQILLPVQCLVFLGMMKKLEENLCLLLEEHNFTNNELKIQTRKRFCQ